MATFDGATREILVAIGTIDAQVELYSDWKEYVKVGNNGRFAPAFDTTGGDPTRPGQSIAPYFFLRNDLGWRIRMPDADGDVLVVGNLFARVASIPIVLNPVTPGFTVLFTREISPQALVVNTATPVIQTSDEAFLEVAFDVATNALKMGTWLHRGSVAILNPTSTQIDWYDAAGALVFTQSSSSPDARGHFVLTRTEALLGNTAYYAVVRVTDPAGSITSHRGVPTVGTA